MENIQVAQAILPLDERAFVCLAAAGVFFLISVVVGLFSSLDRGGSNLGVLMFGMATVFSLACAYGFVVGWLGMIVTVAVGFFILVAALTRTHNT